MQDIVGARAVQAGERRPPAASSPAATAWSSTSRGRSATSRSARRMPFFCAVPPNLPADPEGRGDSPAPARTRSTEYRAGQRVTIRRNRFYRGTRPHHVDGLRVDLTASAPHDVLDRIETRRGRLGHRAAAALLHARAAARRRSTASTGWPVHVQAGLHVPRLSSSTRAGRSSATTRSCGKPSTSPSTGRVRGAGDLGSRLTDQYLPRQLPGFGDARIYPLDGPTSRRREQLARGHLRGGKAVLYVNALPLTLELGQILKRQLQPIGLDVEVKRNSAARVRHAADPRRASRSTWRSSSRRTSTTTTRTHS